MYPPKRDHSPVASRFVMKSLSTFYCKFLSMSQLKSSVRLPSQVHGYFFAPRPENRKEQTECFVLGRCCSTIINNIAMSFCFTSHTLFNLTAPQEVCLAQTLKLRTCHLCGSCPPPPPPHLKDHSLGLFSLCFCLMSLYHYPNRTDGICVHQVHKRSHGQRRRCQRR